MISFYKMNGTQAEVGSGIEVPEGYAIYTVGNEPQELKDAIASAESQEALSRFIAIKDQVVADKLKALRYDSLATVKLWADDVDFGAEATRILEWYKNVTKASIQLENGVLAGTVPMPTEEEYKTMLEGVAF